MNKNTLKNWLWKHKEVLILWGSVVAIYAVLFALDVPCPIKYVTGISCPGCGMSRAVKALVMLDLFSAINYHPLCLALLPAVVGLIWLRARRCTRGYHILLYVSAVVMIAVYLYRLLFLQGDVVVAQPENGLIGRLVLRIIGFFKK